MRVIWLVLIAALLGGCGSGGGSAVGGAVQQSAATIEIGTQAASGATVLYSVQFTLRLPAGVTLAADSATGEVSAGVLLAADSAALAGARYLPATGGARGSVKVIIIDAGGFLVGDLATLACSVAPGIAVDAAGFSLDGFIAGNASGAAIPGITPRLAVRTQ